MGNGMNKVLPGLYLGSFRDGKDSEQLQNNEITHIVSIHDTAKEVVEMNGEPLELCPKLNDVAACNAAEGVQVFVSVSRLYWAARHRLMIEETRSGDKQYLCIRVPDSPDENLTKYFSKCNDFIHGARMGGGNVLVHCLAGVSRSATIAAAYIMSATTLNCKDALKVIRGARDIANPNYGFHTQLKDFESYALTSERKRLKIRYSTYDNQKTDEEECAKMITIYHNNIPSSNNSTPTHSIKKPSSSNSTPAHSFSYPPSRYSSPTHTYKKSPLAHNYNSSYSPTHSFKKSASNLSTPTHTYHYSSSGNFSPTHSIHKVSSSSSPTHSIHKVSSSSSPTHSYHKPSASDSPTYSIHKVSSSSSPTHSYHKPSSSDSPTYSIHKVSSSNSTHSYQEPSSSNSPTHSYQEPSSSNSPSHSLKEPSTSASSPFHRLKFFSQKKSCSASSSPKRRF